jgi:hypothetical protein
MQMRPSRIASATESHVDSLARVMANSRTSGSTQLTRGLARMRFDLTSRYFVDRVGA